ncbi:hypothetical protein BGZ76_002749 [Entomortierella beljakovae]|nr:hypothetical protein BGZ76_002749 [Entomortierella beljakovae]
MGVIERAIPDQDQYLEIRPGLFRCTKIMTIGFFALPIATFLIKGNLIPEEPEAHEWILIDAGAPQAEDLLENIKQVLKHPKDTIKYLCITHGHADHTGATTTILENYSEWSISFLHVPSKSIMIGNASKNHYFTSKTSNLSYLLPFATCNIANAIKSMDKIISLKVRVDTILPAHDYNPEGITVEELENLRKSDPR